MLTGDCLELLADIPAGSFDLIYADPPFATGRNFGEFDDRWDGGLDGFLAYMRPRLAAVKRVLADDGSFWLHCDWRTSAYLRVECDRIFGRGWFRNEVVWCYTGPSNAVSHFPRKSDRLLVLRRAGGSV